MNAPSKSKAPAPAPAPKEPAAVAAKASAAPAKPPLAKLAEKPNAPKPLAKPAKASPAKKIAAKPVVAEPKPAQPDLAKPVIVTPVAGPARAASPDPVVGSPSMAGSATAEPAPVPTPETKAEAAAGYREAVDLSKVTVDALVQSSTAFARGMQDMGKEVMSAAQASLEDTVAASKAMFSARTIKELIDLQSSFARQSLDRLMADTGRISERGVKVAEETFAPINAGFSVAVDKFGKSAA